MPLTNGHTEIDALGSRLPWLDKAASHLCAFTCSALHMGRLALAHLQDSLCTLILSECVTNGVMLLTLNSSSCLTLQHSRQIHTHTHTHTHTHPGSMPHPSAQQTPPLGSMPHPTAQQTPPLKNMPHPTTQALQHCDFKSHQFVVYGANSISPAVLL